MHNPLGTRTTLETPEGTAHAYALESLEKAGLGSISRMPYSIKVLLEAVVRNCDGEIVTEDDIKTLAGWKASDPGNNEVPFLPARVILQDFTGVPAVVDLAAMRSTLERLGGDPERINPAVPVDLVIDHSVQVDVFGTPLALSRNAEIEFERNRERYEFLRWGKNAFNGFRVVPPATGIVHQVNLEFLATVVMKGEKNGETFLFPDSLVGTDSHTTMINGLGVFGWGVGGIEAEAGMLGQPSYLIMPEVIGFKMHGQLREGVTATDLVLVVTQMLREKGVVEKFVEFYGQGLSQMSLPDRATVANMAPEYGATMGFFPVDEETLRFLRRTGRSDDHVARVEAYTKMQGLFRTDEAADPDFTDTLELDLATVEPCLAGPKRPQDRIALSDMKEAFRTALTTSPKERGFGLSSDELSRTASVVFNGTRENVGHGAVVIAAITSCTNTSNPSVMLAAGLLAKKATERGLKVPPYVKTSLAPGSKVVTEYLREAGLLASLADLGFHLVGYGCTTCIGNSGPLPEPVEKAVSEGELVAAAVLSGNRNFEGRIHALVRANYLASPPLVVAYALAGTVDLDLATEPLGKDVEGKPVHLEDIWPSQKEVNDLLEKAIHPGMFKKMYGNVWDGNAEWNKIPVSGGKLYEWSEASTYIQEPPFFDGLTLELNPLSSISGARVLVLLGDSVTTDHISPAADIPNDSPAGQYLRERGLEKKDFNSYGSRRGNDRVMLRGTFANIRIKNQLVPGVEGGYTVHIPSGEQMFIYDAAMRYKEEGTSLVVVAGKEYGTGSSRDWAAKGTLLLGVKAVFAESYERIHRSNLVGMGVLPLQFKEGDGAASLGITGQETFDIKLGEDIEARQELAVTATRPDGTTFTFDVIARLDSRVDVTYYKNGGILHTVLRNLAK
ncbi:MAG: aconitate hydratase AcnA [Acidobacteria bacterium]|nr:MAG: aconitate hydratase AcnA [Acidobacteriota bacterium]